MVKKHQLTRLLESMRKASNLNEIEFKELVIKDLETEIKESLLRYGPDLKKISREIATLNEETLLELLTDKKNEELYALYQEAEFRENFQLEYLDNFDDALILYGLDGLKKYERDIRLAEEQRKKLKGLLEKTEQDHKNKKKLEETAARELAQEIKKISPEEKAFPDEFKKPLLLIGKTTGDKIKKILKESVPLAEKKARITRAIESEPQEVKARLLVYVLKNKTKFLQMLGLETVIETEIQAHFNGGPEKEQFKNALKNLKLDESQVRILFNYFKDKKLRR